MFISIYALKFVETLWIGLPKFVFLGDYSTLLCYSLQGTFIFAWILPDLIKIRREMAMTFFMITDRRLGKNMPPSTYNVTVDGDYEFGWIADAVMTHKHAMTLIFSSHGLPGYVQCCKGGVAHPTAGNGLTIHDIPIFEKMRPKINAIEFHCCLVARIGTSPECGGHIGYDGNNFCSKVAKAAHCTVKASWDIQWGDSDEYCNWAGAVLTYGPLGTVLKREDFPMNPATGACVSLG